MKKIIALIPLLVFLNCGPEAEMYERQYIIENSINYTVKLKFYSGSEPSFDFSNITLESSEKLEGNSFEFSRPISNDPEYTGPRLSFSANSVMIIFDNEKRLNQFIENGSDFSEPETRNIFRHGNYENIGNDQFLYKITEEDYQNATPCDGECE